MTMEFKGTPGPWACIGGDVFDMEGGLVVSFTSSFKRDKVSRQRDISDPLITAAAPELFDALHAVVSVIPGALKQHDLLDGVRDALRKAIGQ